MKLVELLGIIGLVMLVILLIVIGPIASIWAWNTLFGKLYTIDLNFNTWLAVVILGFFFGRSDIDYRSKK